MRISRLLYTASAFALCTLMGCMGGGYAWADDVDVTTSSPDATTTAADDASDASDDAAEEPQLTAISKPAISSVEQIAGGLQVNWGKRSHAASYTITRVDLTESDAKKATSTASTTYCYYQDTHVTEGHTYSYSVTAKAPADSTLYCDSASSKAVSRLYVGTPFVTSDKKSGSSYKIVWESVEGADGYQLQYSTSSLMLRPKTKEVSSTTLSYTASGLSSTKSYYGRVRAFQTQGDGSHIYGPWSCSKAATKTTTTKTKLLKADGATFEVRTAASQSMYGYDILQGSCCDGTFGYYALYNESANKAKIVKVDMSSMRVVKVSKALAIYHANDLCYDTAAKRILVANATGNGLNFTTVNPNTLKVTANKKLSSNVSSLPGAAAAGVTKIAGFSAIAYNPQRNHFAVTVGVSHDFMVLDSNLKAVRYVRPELVSTGEFQGLECTNDLLMFCTSPKNGQTTNALFVYNWDGSFVSRLNISKSYELESVFYKGGRLYASFYRSWFKATYTTKTAKKAKKVRSSSKGKVTVKWKKVSKAKKYTIYYRVAGTKTWKKKTVSASKRSLTLKNLRKSKRYEVKVKATVPGPYEYCRSGYTYKLTSV